MSLPKGHVVDRLASTLGSRDEVPNQELAVEIAAKKDVRSTQELIELLTSGTKAQKSDAIKVLYEIGERKPELIASHVKVFLSLLDSTQPRLVWGAMCALDTVALLESAILASALPTISKAIDRSESVIARDHFVSLIAKLGGLKKYESLASEILINEVRKAPVNQLPSYAEQALPVVQRTAAKAFEKILTFRLETLEQPAKRKRIERVLSLLAKQAHS